MQAPSAVPAAEHPLGPYRIHTTLRSFTQKRHSKLQHGVPHVDNTIMSRAQQCLQLHVA